MLQVLCKNIRPVSNKGVHFGIRYIGVYPKIDVFANFLIFKLLVDVDTHATERYFLKLLLLVKLVAYSVKLVLWHELSSMLNLIKKKNFDFRAIFGKIVQFLLDPIYLTP